jgi:hypothetical protein
MRKKFVSYLESCCEIMRFRKWIFILLLAAVAAFSGCSSVEPWERGFLADEMMRVDRDPLSLANAEHLWFSREAVSGGQGIGGGGCGCN